MLKNFIAWIIGAKADLILGALLITALFGIGLVVYNKGDSHGAARIQSEWNAAQLAEIIQTEKIRQANESAASKIAISAMQKTIALNSKNHDLQKRLQDEIAKFDAYNLCIVPVDGVRVIREYAIQGTRNSPASQRAN